MSIRELTLNMQILGGALAPERLADLVAGLGEVFAPFDLSFRIDHDDLTNLARNTAVVHHSMHLWVGEELGADALTRCPPEPGHDLVRELRTCLGGRSGATAWMHAIGALRHQAGIDESPAWYGRWASVRALRELVEVRLEWSDDVRELEMTFPLNGYPLTPIALRHDYPLEDGSPALAATNRALVLPALMRVRGALGLAPDQVSWSVQGGRSWHHPDVVAELDNVWFPRLRG